MKSIPAAQNQKEFIENSCYYRGKLIDEFCNLELEIERYLVRYFLDDPDDRRALKNLILDRMTFEAKRTALKAMFDEQSIKNGFIKSNRNSYPNSDLLNEIRLLNDQRNYFAHYYLALPLDDDCKNSVICLTEYRDGIKVHSYTEEKFESIIQRIKDAVLKIENIKEDKFST